MSRLLKKQGHSVLVIAPGKAQRLVIDGDGVLRVPSIEGSGDSGFSIPLVTQDQVESIVASFAPEIVHSHHPFLLGKLAQRVSRKFWLPLVFTHHTMYEQQAHLFKVPVGGLKAKLAGALATYALAANLPVAYANECTALLVPTESIGHLLYERGVRRPIFVTPTGIDADRFAAGDRSTARRKYRIPDSAFVVGYVGRLSKEKRLDVWSSAVSHLLKENRNAYALVVGKGTAADQMKSIFGRSGVGDRVRWCGVLGGKDLADAFASMDLFAFASQSETQGLVLAEAMAAGAPVLAFDAPGNRDIVDHGVNGLIIHDSTAESMAPALVKWSMLPVEVQRKASVNARKTGMSYSLDRTTSLLASVYEQAVRLARSV
jgi:glycosyltransferase involved in cell wall biosynthesis